MFCTCRKQRKKLQDRLRQSLRERNAAAKGPQHHPPPENLQLVNVSTVTGNIMNPVHCSVDVIRKNMPFMLRLVVTKYCNNHLKTSIYFGPHWQLFTINKTTNIHNNRKRCRPKLIMPTFILYIFFIHIYPTRFTFSMDLIIQDKQKTFPKMFIHNYNNTQSRYCFNSLSIEITY